MQGRLPGGGAIQLRPESREVSHKGMGKAVQGRGLDVQRPEGRENGACEGGAAEFGGPRASGGGNMRSKRWVEVRSEEEWFLAGRPAVRRLSFLRCHTPCQDDVLCLLGWTAKAAQNRLFNLPHGQEESALSSFGPKGFLYLVVLYKGLK